MTGIVDFTKNVDTTVLNGKCALVTGGASGLGAETVAHLSGYGALVTIADINAELDETYVAKLSSQGLKSYSRRRKPDYSASKWAARGFFRAIRRPMEQQGFRVNLIAPGIIDTPLIGDLKDSFLQNGFPIGDPKDVAKTVVRCVVDDAICGRAIAIGAPKIFDLRDDPEGLDGGLEFKNYLQTELKTYADFFHLL